MEAMGFEVGRASPCNFHHRSRRIDVTVHGGDFLILGDDEQLKWTINEISKRFEIKSEILGPDMGQQKEVKFLNRI